MDIFERLRSDHDKQRTLLELLVETKGDSSGRRELFGRVKKELTAHANAEEQSLYAAMMEQEMTQEKARHSVAEHHEIDELVEDLESRSFSDANWLAVAEKLKELVEHHLDEEEREVFQLAGRALDGKDKQQLAERFRTRKESELESLD